ncbi:MAG: YihY/virulence factor BrkB family protein [Clostridia bacterium]|nr:YihY/virulence factor BrkB family protein [Clostridia bacterium]
MKNVKEKSKRVSKMEKDSNTKKVKKERPFLNLFREKRVMTITGSWVFYFIMSIIPLCFLLITAFSFFGVDLSLELAGKLPLEFREAGELIVGTASNVSNGVTVFFVITVILSCSSLLSQMSKDGDFIYGATHKRKSGFLGKLWVFLMICVLFLTFTVFAFLFSFRNVLLVRLGSGVKNFLTTFFFLLVILSGYAVILILNKFISPIKLKTSSLAFSSFVSLCIIVLGTIGLIIYIRYFSNFNAFYGSLASVIVFFLWAYVLMFGLSFGTLICMNMNKKGQKTEQNLS